MDDVEWNSAMDEAINMIKEYMDHVHNTCCADCADHLRVVMKKFKEEKIKDEDPKEIVTEKHKTININWGLSGINSPPSKFEIDETIKIIQKEAATANVISLYYIRRQMYEWLKNNINNGYIKIKDGENPHSNEVWVLIGIDKPSVVAYLENHM